MVESWPSTVIRSKEPAQAARSAPSGSASSASVCTKQSIVAKPGWIIPAPFACAETVTPSSRSVQLLRQRSVVQIASAKESPPSAATAPAAACTPESTDSRSRGTPITPVSATATRAGGMPSAAAAPSRIASAAS